MTAFYLVMLNIEWGKKETSQKHDTVQIPAEFTDENCRGVEQYSKEHAAEDPQPDTTLKQT